ncbi:hypothetical protein BKK56_03385 [Rodentibacter genomosp. 2]|uniref:hypothetical protein n=1 Tax=Rodentibacter genomosp. 2 TaxID=1908266 RepID=UPI0009867F2B|nr:hypothetical protein BKK56_03385 [Rodentibacter genomosp. 2]
MQADEKFEIKKLNFHFEEDTKEISLENAINHTRKIIEEPEINDNKIVTITGLLNIPWSIYGIGFIDDGKIKDGIKLNALRWLLSPKTDNKNRLVFGLSFDNSEFKNKKLHINNFYILHSDFEDFINGNKYTDGIKGKLEEIEKEKTSPRKQANQAEFIKALLKLHYGIDEPEKARSLLNGELAKKFASAGIEINITPETLRNWLKTEK